MSDTGNASHQRGKSDVREATDLNQSHAVPERFHFLCAACGKIAGTMWLEEGQECNLVRESFTGRLTLPIDPQNRTRIGQWLRERNAKALHDFDFEIASFYCPSCDLNYCREHWSARDVFDDDGWHDSIRGTCPAGHERMLED